MRTFRYLQLDVFTDRQFGGNQLAVFPDATGMAPEEMQAIAREMNFSESTFVLSSTEASALRRVRIFTPATELPFAGHPVIGTTWALAHEGVIREADAMPVILQLGVGNLPVELLFEERAASFVWMHQPIPSFSAWAGEQTALAAALGVDSADLDDTLPIELGSAGVPFIYLPLRSTSALAKARPSPDLLKVLGDSSAHLGIYLFVFQREDGPSVRSRMFAPGMGVSEDAATGSAAGPLGAYLLRHGSLRLDAGGDARLRIAQGIEMGRASYITVNVTSHEGSVTDVRVGGEAVVVASGEFYLR